MEGRKWEDLDADCLGNIFGRVGMVSLLFDIPFVCKSWYKATLSPLCWRRLAFPPTACDYPCRPDSALSSRLRDLVLPQPYADANRMSNIAAFIKYVVKRSDKSATFLVLPHYCNEEALLYVADQCPNLRVLALRFYPRENLWPTDLEDDSIDGTCLISKWKHLEILRLASNFRMPEVIAQISIHCKNLVGFGVPSGRIDEDDAAAIVNLLPNLKYLSLRHCQIKQEYMVMILQGCKKLVYFDCRHCIGFNWCDKEILKLASHITTFMPDGSTPIDDCCDECYYGRGYNICRFGADDFLDHCC